MPIEIAAYVPSINPGTYPAVVTGVETRTSKDGSGDYRRWEFTLDDGTGRTVSATSSIQTSPRSKAGKWIAALLGRSPAAGESVEVIGLPCLVSVIHNDDGFERIDAVMARAKPLQAVQPAALTVADDEQLPF